MAAKVFCKVNRRNNQLKQAYFVNSNGKNYFLFEQGYRKSNKQFFSNGYYLNDKVDYSKLGYSVKKALEKIPIYIKYIEKAYGVSILDKNERTNGKKNYKRQPITWQQIEWEVA